MMSYSFPIKIDRGSNLKELLVLARARGLSDLLYTIILISYYNVGRTNWEVHDEIVKYLRTPSYRLAAF